MIDRSVTLRAPWVVIPFLLALSSNTSAEEVSPYSPTFRLKPSQVLSNSALLYSRNSSSYASSGVSGSSSGSSSISGLVVSQGVSFGLPNDTYASVSGAYSRTVSKSQNVVADQGWLNPAFVFGKTWTPDKHTQLDLGASVTPKTSSTGARSRPTAFSINAGGNFTFSDGLMNGLNVTRNIYSHEDQYPSLADTTSIGGFVAKQMDIYLVNLSLGVQRTDAKSYVSGPATIAPAPTYTYSATAAASRKLTNATWIDFWYRYSDGDNNTRITLPTGVNESNSSNTSNQIGTSVRVLF